MMDTVDTVTAMRRLVAVSMGTIEQPVRVEQQARDVLQAIAEMLMAATPDVYED
eukprot:CAMPEP_0176229214 /NCGR_PEP_ID=MMETSP0121_2-20121125/23673_1 /TAXON_ID=160619 /ORGANISM="Kryptoperidinium foliaceum, Strain CCMP 1326" /LENGTH=53 /DNA_ID=CAMNT_0017568529 /DNA_START=135 /DNA_END=296 /DNA_ORIENTATION=-